MFVCTYVRMYVCMYWMGGWVFIHRYNHIHVKLPQVQHKQIKHKHTSTHSTLTRSYRIHVQIYPLAGPVVTAPESLFLNSSPSPALVLTPLEGTSLASDISTS